MTGRRVAFGLVGAALLAVLCRCSDESAGTVAVVAPGAPAAVRQQVVDGAVAAQREYGGQRIDLITGSDELPADVDGVCVLVSADGAWRDVVEQAGQRGVPIVLIGADAVNADDTSALSQVVTAPHAAGERAAHAMAKLLHERGQVIVIRHSEDAADSTLRERGFMVATGKYPGIELLSTNQLAQGGAAIAAQRLRMLIERHSREGGPPFAGVFSPTPTVAQGVAQVLVESGLAGKVRHVAYGVDDKTIALLERGGLDAVLVADMQNAGRQAVLTMHKHLRGEPVEARIDAGVIVVNRDELNDTTRALLH